MSETAKNEAFELWWNGQTRFVDNTDLAYMVWSEAYEAGRKAEREDCGLPPLKTSET